MTSVNRNSDAIQRHILDLEDARYEAMVAADTARFAQLSHRRLVYTHSNADVDTLASYISKIESRYYVYHHIDHPVDEIIIAGDTAVVVGSMRADISAGGARKALNNKSIAVWHRADDQWLLIAYQPTVIPQAAS
jgi:ketosteroid isomerase-like protein